MDIKIYKSYKQQLNILRSRGMIIKPGSQSSRIIRILERNNYYNIINGYKEPFIAIPATDSTEEKYIEGTKFDEVYALYNFDRELRGIYLKYLLKIEKSFKTVISHEFSKKYGYDNYLKIDNFDSSNADKISATIKLFGDIQQEIARQMSKHHQVVTHYMTNHGYIPLWVLVNVLTFGKIEKFYKCMKPADQIIIAKQFHFQPNEFSKIMHILTIARNKCAHDERFYNIRFREGIHTKSIRGFSSLKVPRKADGSYACGTNDIYAIAIIFALLLSKTDLNNFISDMKKNIEKLQKKMHTISYSAIMTRMGYHDNWDNISLLN